MTSPDVQQVEHSVPLDFPFYLSCPTDSHHATYTWEHNNQTTACQQTGSDCLHLIPAMGANDYGSYRCVSKERNYERLIKEYQLRKPGFQLSPRPSSRPKTYFPRPRGDASKVTSHLMTVLMAMVMVVLL